MMTPEEQLIAAFLDIWETNPKNIFETSGAINGLDSLQKKIETSVDRSNEEFNSILGKWCQDYPELTKAILAEKDRQSGEGSNSRKVKGYQNVSTQESHSLQNQYPQISPSLRERLLKITESKPNE